MLLNKSQYSLIFLVVASLAQAAPIDQERNQLTQPLLTVTEPLSQHVSEDSRGLQTFGSTFDAVASAAEAAAISTKNFYRENRPPPLAFMLDSYQGYSVSVSASQLMHQAALTENWSLVEEYLGNPKPEDADYNFALYFACRKHAPLHLVKGLLKDPRVKPTANSFTRITYTNYKLRPELAFVGLDPLLPFCCSWSFDPSPSPAALRTPLYRTLLSHRSTMQSLFHNHSLTQPSCTLD
jgi:hypothetical protein